ncbi:TPA: NADH-quinone oxidoreductase subunit J, partial [Bacillus cereus]|nr:NADH-quinone oxidoreductase subunit J [Bacillus cereus]
FELTSVILLVALVGAIILAKKDEKEEDSNE